MPGSTPAEREAAANVMLAVIDSGSLTAPGRMTDDDIARQLDAGRQLREAADGDESRIANALADVRNAALAAETGR
ncbi:hypothetical protein [Streptomyces griseus]|uniref:hypothetical protein n=1 Tax=Streptomyces griseus TaxID=1911 RepID=UPI003652806A